MKDNSQGKLNKSQLAAAHHKDGPLLIVAGAGTGKTTVITERIKWLILKKRVKPSEILALSFTDKAAREMESRIDQALPYGYTQMWITTFHAFGDKILRQEALSIGLDPGYKLMTQAESIIFFRKNLYKFNLVYFRPLGNPNKFIEGMLIHFARLKDEDITPNQYIDWVKSEIRNPKNEIKEEKLELDKYQELAQAYGKYEELKVKESLMDFPDLISNTLRLFRMRKNILKEYQDRFKYILIDEFQDTNFAQNSLAVLLTGRKKNLTVVGDDDQAIYRWRGAAISNIIQFRNNFPETAVAVLNQNYRSTAEILDKAYKLIQFNNPDRLEVKEKINKKLKPMRKIRGEEVGLVYSSRVEDEAEQVVEKIKDLKSKLKDNDGNELYSWKDFAILVRANNHADPFVRALGRAGIPYQFLGPGMLFRQPEVKDLIAYLMLLDNIEDSVALFRVLSMDIFGFDAIDLVLINNFAKKTGISIYEAIDIITAFHQKESGHWSLSGNYREFIPHLSEITLQKLARFIDMIRRHLKMVKTETAGQLLYYFIQDSGLLKTLANYKSVKEEKTVLNITKFFDKLKSFESEHEDASISSVVDFISMSLELGESPIAADIDWSENDAVNILTIHSSKGLEFPVVFLVNLVTNRFPTVTRKEQIPIPEQLVKEILPEGDYHLEEERRLFYVGMTRAKDKLYITASNYYGEGKRERKISPFVIEVFGSDKLFLKKPIDDTVRQLVLPGWQKTDEVVAKSIPHSIEYLSYSQIDSFTTCPLQYKYRYVMKIPVPPTASGSFGTSMHKALEEFYKAIKEGRKPEKRELIGMLENNWIPVGYRNKNYEKKMRERGKDMLSFYFREFYDPKLIPFALEQVFKIRLAPDLKIGGKIDRIDILPDGKMEIIDYKTGKRPDDREIKKNLQMTVYSLAATDKGIYGKKPEDVILSFYFLDAREKVSSTRSQDQMKEARTKLVEKAAEIEKSSFNPKTGPWCGFCDFRLICEAWQ